MSSNKFTANPDRDASCANVLTFSNNEKQLLEILNMPPEIACEIAVPLEIRHGIYSIPGISNLVHLPDEEDLFTVCRVSLAGLIHRYLQDTDDIHLRGLLLIWIIKSHVLYRGYSIKRALSIVQSANIVDDLFEMLTEYGFINESESATLSKSTLSRTLERLSVVDDRTAQRHFSAGLKLLSSVLGAYLPVLSSLGSPKATPDELELPTESLDIISRLTQFASAKYRHAPAVADVVLPMEMLSSLPILVNGILLESKNLLNHLAGRSGIITGSRGSGRTTLMMALGANRSQNSSGAVCYYVSAPDYLPYAQQGLGYEYLIVDQLLGDDVNQKDIRTTLLAQVKELDSDGSLTLLIDNIDHLTPPLQQLVLWQLSKAKSIYFSILPWVMPKIDDAMQKYGFSSDLIKIELVDLDFPRINEICNTSYRIMEVENPPQNTAAYIHSQFGKLACTPLAVVAACQAGISSELRIKEYPERALVSELLRRDGLRAVPIPRTLDSRDTQVINIIRLGRAVRYHIEREQSYDLMDDDPEHREPVWMPISLLQEDFGVSLDTIAKWRVFALDEPGNRVRFYCRVVEEHIASVSCYYLGTWHRTILDGPLGGLKGSVIGRILQDAASWARLYPESKNDNPTFMKTGSYV